jgi:thiosulfate dehydrogenase [quinone] large subunit
MTFAHLIARLFVAMRLFMAGLDKFRGGDGANVSFNFDNYTAKTDRIAKLMSDNSCIPAALCGPYAHSIGYILLIVGVWSAIGIMTEFSLLAAGLTFLSLGFGLSALPDDMELTANIGVCIIITVAALVTAKHKQLSVDGILFGRKG